MKKRILQLFIFMLVATSSSIAQNQNVTFQVTNTDSTPVFLFGSWTGFSNWPGNLMSNLGGGTWSITIPLPANATYEYLYVNGGQGYAKELLDPAWPCTNGNTQYTNRVLNLGSTDTALCQTWETCFTCPIIPPPVNVTVSFQVQNPDSTPVYVFGSWTGFGNWPGDLMTDANGDGIYEKDITLASNATYEYLFVNGVGPTKEVLDPSWPCTNGNGQYTNRVINVGSSNMVACNRWELCDTCGSVILPTVNATFIVENPDSTPVFLFGSWNGFNNWPGTPMTLQGNGTWQASLNLYADSTVEYLYVNGNYNTPAKEILDPTWPCTNGNAQYTNRVLALGTTNVVTCSKFALCTNCSMAGINEIPSTAYTVSLTENSLIIHSSIGQNFDALEVFDMIGKRVYTSSNKVTSNTTIPVILEGNKMYLIRLKSGNSFYTIKQIAIHQQ